MQTLALSAAASSMDYEAKRLEQLAAAGVRVPKITLQVADLFILEYCGAIVGTLINQ